MCIVLTKVTENYLGVIELIFSFVDDIALEFFLPSKSIVLKKDNKFMHLSLILIKFPSSSFRLYNLTVKTK